MLPDRNILTQLQSVTTGANIHRAKNLELAYKGLCRLYDEAKSDEKKKRVYDKIKKAEADILKFIEDGE